MCVQERKGSWVVGWVGTEKVHAAKGERSMTYDNIGKAMTQNAFAGSSETSFPCSPGKRGLQGCLTMDAPATGIRAISLCQFASPKLSRDTFEETDNGKTNTHNPKWELISVPGWRLTRVTSYKNNGV